MLGCTVHPHLPYNPKDERQTVCEIFSEDSDVMEAVQEWLHIKDKDFYNVKIHALFNQ